MRGPARAACRSPSGRPSSVTPAAGRPARAGEQAEQRRLARAVRPEDADDRARRHLERHARQHGRAGVVGEADSAACSNTESHVGRAAESRVAEHVFVAGVEGVDDARAKTVSRGASVQPPPTVTIDVAVVLEEPAEGAEVRLDVERRRRAAPRWRTPAGAGAGPREIDAALVPRAGAAAGRRRANGGGAWPAAPSTVEDLGVEERVVARALQRGDAAATASASSAPRARALAMLSVV